MLRESFNFKTMGPPDEVVVHTHWRIYHFKRLPTGGWTVSSPRSLFSGDTRVAIKLAVVGKPLQFTLYLPQFANPTIKGAPVVRIET